MAKAAKDGNAGNPVDNNGAGSVHKVSALAGEAVDNDDGNAGSLDVPYACTPRRASALEEEEDGGGGIAYSLDDLYACVHTHGMAFCAR